MAWNNLEQPGIKPVGHVWKNAGMCNKEIDYFEYTMVHLYTQADYHEEDPLSTNHTEPVEFKR